MEILWVGSQGGVEEELVKRVNIPYRSIPAAGVHGVGLHSLPGNLARLGNGFLAARQILGSYKPDVLLFTGGYVAVPMALAARTPIPQLRKPANMLFVPDIEPGQALKALAHFSDCIAVTAENSRGFFPGHRNIVLTGYPIRPGLTQWDRERAKQVLNLDSALPTLLVFGGSLGAHSINQALFRSLTGLLGEMQIIHISGKLDWQDVETVQAELQKTHPNLAIRYHAYPYLHEEMGAALTAADLVISRAGASSLGEFPNFGLPAILVPYPHAWRYQQVNAEYLQSHGAAIMIGDGELADRIYGLVRDLMKDDDKRNAMRQAMQKLAKPHAAVAIIEAMVNLFAQRQGLQSW